MSVTLILFLLFLVVSVVWPAIRQRVLESARLRAVRDVERMRDSRVIALIHRQETMALLGFPVFRYIDIEDSEEVLRAIKLTDETVPIDLILHTPGGLVLAAEQIAHALCRHPSHVTVFVPHYAMSGGTLVALAADEIVMDENAVLGPVDPQIGELPAASIIEAVQHKGVDHLEDHTLILADVATKAIRQVRETVRRILVENRMNPARAEALSEILSSGTWTHDYPISAEEARALGLPVTTEMPEEIYKLMSLYRQPRQHRPSVSYIPIPYRRREQEGPPSDRQ
jgi:ClpP class serine protease